MTVITEGRVRKLYTAYDTDSPFRRDQMYRKKYTLQHSNAAQEEVYKLLTSSSDRPVSSSLSPYLPLPAIGSRFLNGTSKKEEMMMAQPITSKKRENAGSRSVPTPAKKEMQQKLERERTYDVLEPKFVKGPDPEVKKETSLKEKRQKMKKRPSKSQSVDNNLSIDVESSAIFGPKLINSRDVEEFDFERPWTTQDKTVTDKGRRDLTMKRSSVEMELSSALKSMHINEAMIGSDKKRPQLHTAYWFDL